MTLDASEDSSIQNYIESTRLLVTQNVPESFHWLAETAVSTVNSLVRNGQSLPISDKEFEHINILSLNKHSEYVCVDDKHYLLTDHYLSLQASFLNKQYFKISEKGALSGYLCTIAAQQALLKGFLGAAQILNFSPYAICGYETYVKEVKKHLKMETIQRVLNCIHEYLHCMVNQESNVRNDFEIFHKSFLNPKFQNKLYEEEFSVFPNRIEVMAVMRDRDFVEELFCDYRAANFTHNFMFHQKEIFGSRVLGLEDFFFACITYFINLEAIKSVEESVNAAIAKSEGRDTATIENRSKTRSMSLNLRRFYMRRQLRLLGNPARGVVSKEYSHAWNRTIDGVTARTDEVALEISSAIQHVCALVVPFIFLDNVTIKTGFPVVSDHKMDLTNRKSIHWRDGILMSMAPDFEEFERIPRKDFGSYLQSLSV